MVDYTCIGNCSTTRHHRWFKAQPCSVCHSQAACYDPDVLWPLKRVVCNNCGATGPFALTRKRALARYNKRNKPGLGSRITGFACCGTCIYGVPRKDLSSDLVECLNQNLIPHKGVALLVKRSLHHTCIHYERERRTKGVTK